MSDFGSFHGKFEIASDASLGYHSISIAFPFDGEYGRYDERTNFLVAEYRLPEYQVSLGQSAAGNRKGRDGNL